MAWEAMPAEALGRREVVLEAGDVLWLPAFWWHEVSSEGAENVSLSVWFHGRPPEPRRIMLGCGDGSDPEGRDHARDGVLVGVGRNLEMAATEALAAALAGRRSAEPGEGLAVAGVSAVLRRLADQLVKVSPVGSVIVPVEAVAAADELARSLGPTLLELFGGEAVAAAGFVRALLQGGRLDNE